LAISTSFSRLSELSTSYYPFFWVFVQAPSFSITPEPNPIVPVGRNVHLAGSAGWRGPPALLERAGWFVFSVAVFLIVDCGGDLELSVWELFCSGTCSLGFCYFASGGVFFFFFFFFFLGRFPGGELLLRLNCRGFVNCRLYDCFEFF